jgi:hypothetical protein
MGRVSSMATMRMMGHVMAHGLSLVTCDSIGVDVRPASHQASSSQAKKRLQTLNKQTNKQTKERVSSGE